MNKSYIDFGESLRIEREKLGLEQAGLAKALGTTQQTISRWEKGGSRPKSDMTHKIAELFEDTADEWLAKAGYKIAKPVRPLLDWLPLDSLSEEKFELFNVELVEKLHPNASVHRYGHRGHKQNGIDLFAKEDGDKLDYQAKRHKQFGKEKVHEAVQETTMVAKRHHLLLSRQASTEARDAIDEYDDWSLWDVEDISRKVRSLSSQDKIDLVDTYFPGYRKDFLGVDEPSPWLTPDKYFRPFNNKTQLFNHDWNFYGRKTEVEKLTDFATSSHLQVQVLVGRGGVGKTRLLKELALGLGSVSEVRFMTQRAEPKPSDIEVLPKKGLLIIEDAHESSDLRTLLSRIAIERPRLKVILSIRPYGQTYLEGHLVEAGMSFDQTSTIKVDDMKLVDAVALASHVLAENGATNQHAKKIAEITLDCPLATVVGARLVADGEIQPEILNNSEKFRLHVMKSFRDVIAGQISGGKDGENIQDLLALIAVIQPINQTDPAFEAAIEAILGRPYDKVVRDLKSLEDAGVIIRRKNGIRIAPDLLADFIRAEATFDSNSKLPTRYADRVFKVVNGELATNLLVNLSQLDWRLIAYGFQAALLDSIWQEIKQEFLKSEINGRITILKTVEKVAYYQPAESLKFVRLALDSPTEKYEKTEFDDLFDEKTTYTKVIRVLPDIIKLAAFNANHLPEALDLLKEIANIVGRPSNWRTQDHPVSVMKELVVITPRKPIGYIEIAVEHVLKWLADSDLNFSPFDVLDGALISEGHDTQFHGSSITINPFKVRIEVIKETRDKIIDAAFETITNGTSKGAVRAVDSLEGALRRPMQDATIEDKAKWVPGELELLGRLSVVAGDEKLDPFISVQIRRAVNWHSNFSKSETRSAAIEVLKAIPDTLGFNLTRALADGWGWTFERGTDFERDEQTFNDWKINLADNIVRDFDGRYESLIAILEERIATLERLEVNGSNEGGRFVYDLVQRSPAFAEQMARYTLDNPKSSLRKFLGNLIAAMSSYDYDAAISLAGEAVVEADVIIERIVAHALGWMLSENVEPSEQELRIINQLTSSKDVIARKSLVRVVKRFPDTRKLEALDLLNTIGFSDSDSVAGEVLGEFNEAHGAFKFEQLTPDQLDKIFEQLVSLKTVDEYGVQEFVQEASYYFPEKVLKLMFDRVDCKADLDYKKGYYPIPISWERRDKLRISETSAYQDSLERVRDWVNQDRDDWHRRHYGPEIFRAISVGLDETTFKVLNEWSMSDDPGQVESAASLISEFPVKVMWDNLDVFIGMLEHAQELGVDTYKSVSSSLHSMAYQGERTTTPGEPFPQDVLQLEMSIKTLSSLPRSSAAFKFFESLKSVAEEAIERERHDGEDEEE